MNIAEAAAMRELVARVNSLENTVKDQQRRLDDLSNAERSRTERENQTLRLKKQA